ncbi:MAG: lipopolysaccharide heptosyltransferase II [Fusobacteriia bacterium 4572_132]|nr:MAG: lipopolysaccharide heptosyltransferase II [Fusobacteriia bacterium 4572_132]
MKKILIIHTAFIGDIVLSTPLIRAIKEKYKNSEIYYLTTPSGKAILKNNPNLKKIISYDKNGKDKGIKKLFDLIKVIKEERFDIAIIPHRYLKSSLIAFGGKIKERIGYSNSEGQMLLTDKIKYQKNIHEVQRLLSLIEEKNVSIKKNKIELYPGKKEIKKVDEIWKKYNLKGNKVIIIAPGSKWFTKMWPIEYYNELIKKLIQDENNKVILVGGNDEKDLKLIQDEKILNLIGKTSLLELAELLKKSDLLVGNDSSPLHIASAFNTKIIAMFGATTKSLGFYPWSKNSVVLENKNLECRPCGLHGGNTCPEKHFKCMREIKPEEVLEEIEGR